MNLRILAKAEADFASIVQYYVGIGNYEGDYSLALRFENEVLNAFEFIRNYPEAAHHLNNEGIRAYHLRKFPVSVVYQIEANCVLILSIHDQRRNPKFLNVRIRNLNS